MKGGSALSTFLRPNLGAVPPNLRRWLEPAVAVLGLSALGALAMVGSFGAALVMLAAMLAYLVVSYVFGIRFDLNAGR